MPTAYVALGSNLGDRLAHLRGAVRRLDDLPRTRVEAASPVYETAAVTADDSKGPPYLNAVLRLETDLEPRELLESCLSIEQAAGRSRRPGVKWEARSLDIDVLVYDDCTIRTDGLVIPHPSMHDRRFVLQPLGDIAPDLHIPDPYDVSVRYLLDQCRDREPIRTLNAELIERPHE